MSTSSQLIRVFVYGTLKRGQPNHYLMTDAKNGIAKFITEAKTCEKFPLVIATRYNIPFLLNQPGTGHHVNGEIYEVNESMFAVLDKLEDYPHWYDRQIYSMLGVDGTTKLDCWIYMLKIFPQNMLKLEFITNYESKGDKEYLERSKRTIPPRDDLEYGIN